MPITPYREVRSDADLQSALDDLGYPAVLKTAAFGYDGKTWGRGAYMFVPNGARTQELRATEATEFFVITLPMLADLAALSRSAGVAHPAAVAK